MQKVQNFKGKIFFYEELKPVKKTLMSYKTEPMEIGFDQTMMCAFDFLNFSSEEKKHLSKKHRDLLSSYRQINPFTLNADAQEFIGQIKLCKSKKIKVEANDYGAYICLAALYSGKLPEDKIIEFIFEKSPLALFPLTLLKKQREYPHKVILKLTDDCWLKPFSSLCQHDKIKFSLKAA